MQCSEETVLIILSDKATVKKLVAEMPDLNIRGKEDSTPLILAAQKGKGEIVDILLKAGAYKDLQDKDPRQ